MTVDQTQALFGNRKVDHIIVHCSATPPTHDWTSEDIDRDHRAKGYLGNGYHIVIRRDGGAETQREGFKCRPFSRAGAHVGDCGPGWNARSLGICLIGGVNADMEAEDNFTPEQRATLKTVLEDLRKLLPDAKIMGHRDLIAITGAKKKKTARPLICGNLCNF